MKIIRMTPNESGAYSPIQEGSFSKVPEGMAEWPETLSTETFYEYKGFASLDFEEVDGHWRVADCQPNAELFEAWEVEHPETEAETPEPTIEERVTTLEGTSAEMTEALELILSGATEDET